MNVQLSTCRVHFPTDYDDRGEWEVERKGWLQGVQVELPNGSTYPLFFYDPVRLAQDFEAESTEGRCVLAEPGLVVISEVTRPNIVRAVEELCQRGYFNHLRPLIAAELNGAAY
jgi:hypothetical protein